MFLTLQKMGQTLARQASGLRHDRSLASLDLAMQEGARPLLLLCGQICRFQLCLFGDDHDWRGAVTTSNTSKCEKRKLEV